VRFGIDAQKLEKPKVIKTWRNDYQIYLDDLKTAYEALIKDKKFIAQKQRYNKRLDILLSFEKSYVEYWATEEGWQQKKKSKSVTLDWRSTFTKSLSMNFNKVYIDNLNGKLFNPLPACGATNTPEHLAKIAAGLEAVKKEQKDYSQTKI